MRSNRFGNAAGHPDDKQPLEEYFHGLDEKTPEEWLKTAAANALADGWLRSEIRAYLEAAKVSDQKIDRVLPKPAIVHPRPVEGLAKGYCYDKRGQYVVRPILDESGDSVFIKVCSRMRVVCRMSENDGSGWSVHVAVTDERGIEHLVVLSQSEIESNPTAAIAALADKGLQIFAPFGRSRASSVLEIITNADAPSGYLFKRSGWHPINGEKTMIFALPDNIIGDPPQGEKLIWAGDNNLLRTATEGTLQGWKDNVAGPVNGLPIPMVAIGCMLAGPCVPFLPKNCETNTLVHFVGASSTGKTTTLQAAASVWGKGAKTSDPESFIHTWRTTINALENLLAVHTHIGAVFDEIKTLDAKAAATLGYDVASGAGKSRMMSDGGSRKTKHYSGFILSSGELTIKERGEDGFGRAVAPDAGAAVRGVDLVTDRAFDAIGGATEQQSFVERLGVAAATDYGHAGPAFARWIAEHPDKTREALAKALSVWDRWMTTVLPKDASGQAKRLASRLGPIAAAASLAAYALDLPWVNAPTATTAQGAAMWAFGAVLRSWLDAHNGGRVTTEAEALTALLRNFILANEAGFDEKTPSKRYGWLVHSGRATHGALELEWIDVLPGALTDHNGLGLTATKREKLLQELDARGLLVTQTPKAQPGKRRLSFSATHGRSCRVYRINVAFLAG
jgi:putative DNA primase/helicase